MAKCDFLPLKSDEKYEMFHIRFRTIGDMSCTGATISDATTLEDIISEVAASRVTERGGRADDKRSDAAMEAAKKKDIFNLRYTNFILYT